MSGDLVTLAVMAKAPEPGRVKTRLCPPLLPGQAATLAAAALRDTLECVAGLAGTRHVLVLDGAPPAYLPRSFEVLPQREASFAGRLAGAFADIAGPTFLVGMDTPQLTHGLLRMSLASLRHHAATLGPALDGGYWAIGLRKPDARVFDGVPMSREDTFAHQRRRLNELSLGCEELPALRDVDSFADVALVAAEAPGSHFASAARRLLPTGR